MVPNIKCDAFDEINFFCIYYYYTTSQDTNSYRIWEMYYKYGQFDSRNINLYYVRPEVICRDMCSYGNIIKINTEENENLVCYAKQYPNNFNIYGLICQYYYFENNNLVTEQIYDFWEEPLEYDNKPLNFYYYENSIFI